MNPLPNFFSAIFTLLSHFSLSMEEIGITICLKYFHNHMRNNVEIKIIKIKDTHCIPSCQVKARATGNFNININIAGTLISCALQSLVICPLGLHLEPS